MKKLWLILLITIVLIGCRPENKAVIDTPAPTVAALSGQPIPVTLSELAANPTVFEGAHIQLTGRYTRLPRLICKSKAQPSPATWGVSSDNLIALAGGFDGQLRPLLPENLTMTIAGRWQYWNGPVGCGNSAQTQDVWYLAVSSIISPNPIAQITLTPGGIVAESGGEATAVTQLPPDNQPGEEGTAVVSPTPIPDQSTRPPATPHTTTTMTAVFTPPFNTTGNPPTPTTPPQISTGTPTTSSTAPASPTTTNQTTATPSNTPLPGTTATHTATPSATPTASSNPNHNNVIMGNIDPEDLSMDIIPAQDGHQWTFENETAANQLIVNAVSASAIDIAITILDPNGNVLLSQNNAAAGQVEIIAATPLPTLGEYQIIISSANNISGDYALLVLDRTSFPIAFNTISYNNTVITNFNENNEQFWFFTGSAHDVLTITAAPDSNADVGIELFGAKAQTLADVDAFGEGQTEELNDYSLPNSGLYALWLGGEAAGLITVNLTVTKN